MGPTLYGSTIRRWSGSGGEFTHGNNIPQGGAPPSTSPCWLLEHEKPTQMQYDRQAEKLESMTRADGTQVWRNPKSMEIPLSKN
jgi:hypothetical protein